MNIQSSLFATVTDSDIRAMLESALDTAPIKYRLMPGGLFNTTYFVKTADCGDVILRVGPINRHLLLHFEHDMMEAEAIVYRLCAAHDIPASVLLAVDTSKTLLDRDFMIVRYIPSTTYKLSRTDYTYASEDVARLYRELGENIAKLHALTETKFGHVYDVAHGRGHDTWSGFLKHELEQLVITCAPHGILTEVDVAAMRDVLDCHTTILDEITVPRLIHADLGPNNLLIRTDTPTPTFGAFIDPDRAVWGDPDFDFAYMEWMRCDELWQGYGHTLATDDASLRRRLIYKMIRWVCNAFVWEVEYNRHDFMVGTVKEIREILTKLK